MRGMSKSSTTVRVRTTRPAWVSGPVDGRVPRGGRKCCAGSAGGAVGGNKKSCFASRKGVRRHARVGAPARRARERRDGAGGRASPRAARAGLLRQRAVLRADYVAARIAKRNSAPSVHICAWRVCRRLVSSRLAGVRDGHMICRSRSVLRNPVASHSKQARHRLNFFFGRVSGGLASENYLQHRPLWPQSVLTPVTEAYGL